MSAKRRIATAVGIMAVHPTRPLPIPRRRLQATEEVTHKHPRGDAAVLGAGEMDGRIGDDVMICMINQIPNMLARIPTVAPRGSQLSDALDTMVLPDNCDKTVLSRRRREKNSTM